MCVRALRHCSAPCLRAFSLLRALHTSPRVQSTLDACTRASPHAVSPTTSGHAHDALTRQHALARQTLDVMLVRHWPLADRRPAGRWRTWHAHDSQMPRHLRCSRGPCVIHTLCLPFTIAVGTVCSEMMMTSEMKTRNTMMKTDDTMEDASECVSPATAPLMRQNARASTPPLHRSTAERADGTVRRKSRAVARRAGGSTAGRPTRRRRRSTASRNNAVSKRVCADRQRIAART